MLGAVEVRAKSDALVRHPAQTAEAEHLKAAGIGEDRPGPGHEIVQAAQAANQLVARPQVKMVGIAENDLRVELFEIPLRLALYRRPRADGHERRCFDHPVGSGQPASTRAGGIGGKNLEMKTHPAKCIRRKQPSSRPWRAHRRARSRPPTGAHRRISAFSERRR